MRYNIFKNGTFINSIASDLEFVNKYCSENNYTYELLEEPDPLPDPEPMTTEEIEETLLDQEYRITLLEMGVAEDDLQNS